VASGKCKGEIVKIPYHLIDVVGPTEDYDLARFLDDAKKAIDDILERGKLPIVAGGTHLWAQALVDGYDLSRVKPDFKLRQKLEALPKEKVQDELRKINKGFFERLNNSEQNNIRRLIRYIEILNSGGEVDNKKAPDYEFLVIALKWNDDDLHNRIHKRIIQRLSNEDMLGEVERLHHEHKVPWLRLLKFGLEYKYCTLHLTGKLDYDAMVEELYKDTKKFAKRQITWLKRWQKQGQEIHFTNKKTVIRKKVKEFLK
jgi:tRNA dimethylallyltransferase